MRKNELTLNIFFLIVMTDIAESIAQLFMKTGLNQTGIDSVTFANLQIFFQANITNVYIWLGIFIYIINFFAWITILTRIDLSVAFPVGSTSYIFVPLLSLVFLHETVHPARWAGIALIVAGIHFVSMSAKPQNMKGNSAW